MKNLVVIDCEVFPNYFLIAFKNLTNKKVLSIESFGENSTLSVDNVNKILSILKSRTTFGFNSQNYDIPIILYALRFKTCKEICDLSNLIISKNLYGWQTLQQFGLIYPNFFKHFDIQEVAPGVRVSLKLYGARMNSKRLQDLPIEPNTFLKQKDADIVKDYCINDLNTTIDLYESIEKRVELREILSKKYNFDVKSKSDAQIAEVVIKHEFKKFNLIKKFIAPKINREELIFYKAPKYLNFKSKDLKEAFDFIKNHGFKLEEKGSIYIPKKLKDLKIKINQTEYKLGIGGLHSTEKSQTVIPCRNQYLIDKDVSSYYPSIILNLGLYPKQLGSNFLHIYRKIVNERLLAKKEKNKIVNDSLKIVINGTFGKLGSKWSFLYSPDLMLTVTLTGQLALLKLIENLENNDIQVISANTDGFVSLLDKSQYDLYSQICNNWQQETSFILEETFYKALYSRDVNNYLAFTLNGKSKTKGIFAVDNLSKNPQGIICYEAISNLLSSGIPIKKTIMNCKDITKFLHVRSVTGGAVYKNQYLGKVVRWIYSTNGSIISYQKNGNKVAKSDNSRPIMEFDKNFPKDIDYERYVKESREILNDLGVLNFKF